MKHYIYGAGGHGKVVLDAMQKAGISCDGFIDDRDLSLWMGLDVFKPSILDNKPDCAVHLAIGYCQDRAKIATSLPDAHFFSVNHPAANISSTAKLSAGVLIAAGAIIGPDACVGKHTILNHHSVVDHDCVINDFCHIAPNVSLGGGVKIGFGVLVGAGAVVLPDLVIGDCAIIGAGAVITKNVAARMVMAGNPAHIISEVI